MREKGDEGDPRSDELLVEAMNRGDERAFEALYLRYRDWVVRLARRFTGHDDDALDVLQETFAYFLRKFPGFRLEARMTTFLFPVVRNVSIRVSTKRRRHTSNDDSAGVEPAAADPPPDLDAERAELARVLGGLPEGQREALLLRFVDDLSLEEIAEMLEIPTGTVKSRLHHAIRTLRGDPAMRRYFLEGD